MNRNTTVTMMTYSRLRDGVYIVSVLLCFISFLLDLNGHKLGDDGSLQKIFLSHDQEHQKALLVLFWCATTLGLSFLPNLIIETAQTKTTEEATDSFLLERYLFILSFIMPSFVGLYGVYHQYQHTAYLYAATTGNLFVTFGYIITRILERSTYTKVWTRTVLLTLFILRCILYTIVIPFGAKFGANFIVKNIIGLFMVAIPVLIYHFTYLNTVEFRKIFMGEDVNRWKESVAIFISIANVISICLQIIISFMFGSGLRYNTSINSIKAFGVTKVSIFVLLSCVLNTIPRTNLAVSKARSYSLQQFIRQMCHELRTPLSIARMGLGSFQDMLVSLKDALTISDYFEMKELLDESIEAMDTSVELLNETLQIDKIESGLLVCEKDNKSLGHFIRKAANIFHGKCTSKNVNLNINICKDEKILRTIVNIDESKMALVLRNFLSNALKFTPDGESITINAHTFYKEDSRQNTKVQPWDIEMGSELPSDNFVRVEVIDTGIGISKEHIDKLFNQSVQISANRSQGGGGSGFGLLIAKNVAEIHGGNVGVTSRGLDQGSCFYFEIPIVKISVDVPTRSGANSCPSTPTISNRKNFNENSTEETRAVEQTRKELSQIIELSQNEESRLSVLIVEDAKPCAKMLAKFLDKCNLDTVCVYNGQEAVDEI